MAETNKTAELLYQLMLRTTPTRVARSALGAIDGVQGERAEDQLLGLAAVLICLLHQYKLSHVDVLGIADNLVYSGECNNIRPEFKVIRNYMKQEWEITNG